MRCFAQSWESSFDKSDRNFPVQTPNLVVSPIPEWWWEIRFNVDIPMRSKRMVPRIFSRLKSTDGRGVCYGWVPSHRHAGGVWRWMESFGVSASDMNSRVWGNLSVITNSIPSQKKKARQKAGKFCGLVIQQEGWIQLRNRGTRLSRTPDRCSSGRLPRSRIPSGQCTEQ